MDIRRVGAAPSQHPTEHFTGHVRMDPLAPAEAGVTMLHVHFDPGARTHWHTHPEGQVLFVTQGVGRCQSEGGPVQTIRPGDVVRFAPGERHWHGAGPETGMSHVAVQPKVDGRTADWEGPVSDGDYAG